MTWKMESEKGKCSGCGGNKFIHSHSGLICEQCGQNKAARKPFSNANAKQIGGNHYKTMTIQPWDVADTWPIEQQIGVYRHGALKYLMRMGSKDADIQEIGKAVHYCEKLVEVLKKKAES